jgi:Cytochrome bd terminal oxidase subunit I
MPNIFAARARWASHWRSLLYLPASQMPLLMVIAEWLHLKTGDDVYYTLARRWAVGTAITFAFGAVSAPKAPDVFVIGDLASITSEGKPVPEVAPAAHKGCMRAQHHPHHSR